MVDDLVPAPPAGGRAASAPLLGRDTEPTLFELSEPGRRAWQLRTTGVPDRALDELVPDVHRRASPVALAEVSERDLVGHFTRLSHRQFPSPACSSCGGYSATTRLAAQNQS